MLTYPVFYKAHGIRTPEQLKKPNLALLSHLFLPVNSIYHYASSDGDELGIPESDTVVSHVKNTVFIDHVVEMQGDAHGKPLLSHFQPKQGIAEYQSTHKKMKLLSHANKGIMRSVQSLVAVNYNMLTKRYHYMETRQTPYNHWANVHETMWAKINEISVGNDRQHYFVLDIPFLLPAVRFLKLAKTTHDFYHHFHTDSLRMIRDMWDWLGVNRDESVLSHLNKDILNRVNIILSCGAKWCVINLGLLDSWRIGGKEEKRTGAGFMKMSPEQLQIKFLYSLVCIVKQSTPVASDSSEDLDDDTSSSKQVDLDMEPTERGIRDAAKKKEHVTKTLASIIGKQAATVAANKGTQTDEEIDEEIPEISDEDIEKDLAALDEIHESIANAVENGGSYKKYEPQTISMESNILAKADALAKKGLMTPGELRRITSLASAYKKLKNPYTGEGSLESLLSIAPEETAIGEQTPMADDIVGVMDKTMLSSSLIKMDRQYIQKVMPKDIAKIGLHLQRAGFAVTDYRIEKTDDVMDSFDTHVFRLVPVVGKPSTIRIQLPRVNEDGTFRCGGIKYRMRKQRGDVPIRKIAPDTVALTSYYSKMFVVRSERAVFNYPLWLCNQIVAKGLDSSDNTVTELRPANVFDPDIALPRAYTMISMRISGFTSGDKRFSFDYNKRHIIFGENTVKAIEDKRKLIPVGTTPNGVLAMDKSGIIYFIDTVKEQTQPDKLGLLEEIVGIPLEDRPVEMAEVELFSKNIPLGVILAYHIGLGNLIATLGVSPRRVRIGSGYDLQPHEFILKFEDEALIFDRRNELATLLLSGFNRYHRDIKRYSVYAFDTKDVYGPVFEANEMNSRYIREFGLIFDFWIDHITEELLVDMKEPTDMFGLFISAAEKLLLDQHPAEMHSDYLRDKGYERFAGLAYFELVKALRTYNAKPANVNNSLDLNPQAVWMNILQDQTVSPVEDSNPIHAMKDMEVVVFSGSGGRSARSLTGKSRVYDKSNMGVVSEATVDSADVATITYTTADPNYKSVRGTSRRIVDPNKDPAKMVSPSFMLSPGVDHDDPKRANAISVQNSQTTHCENYKPSPIRTGYERVVIHRSEGLYGKVAKEDGKVISITDKTITVEFKGGEKGQYLIGRQFGRWSGHDIPHDITTDLKEGQSFKKGDPLIYNTRYFQRDTLDPSQVLFKMSTLAYTALMEKETTLEDSSALSQEMADKLVTMATHIRNIKVTFDQEIRNLVQVGDKLESESILCTIHNRVEGNSDVFDDEAINTLSNLSSSTPLAKMTGVVDKIEVFYTGEIEDMSTSLQHLVEASDRDIRRTYKELGKKAVDGRVDVGFRVDGHPMALDEAVVRLYVTGPETFGEGDKLVFSNQLKSVTGEIMSDVNETESGIPLDAIFSYQSVANRITLSGELIGTTNSLLLEIGRRAVAAYRGKP